MTLKSLPQQDRVYRQKGEGDGEKCSSAGMELSGRAYTSAGFDPQHQKEKDERRIVDK